jgi:hypothetical protein
VQNLLEPFGGSFGACLLFGFLNPPDAPRVSTLQQPVYTALLEILLGSVTLPSDTGVEAVEAFGRVIDNADALPLILRTAPVASWALRRDIMKVCVAARLSVCRISG